MAGAGRAPSWLRTLLGLTVPRRDRSSLLHEMDVLYERRAVRDGRRVATVWYAAQVPSFVARLIAFRAARVMRRRSGAGNRGRGRDRQWKPTPAETIGRILRLGFRGLVRVPLYAAASAATLGIGIAAVSAVHAVANWTLLRPVPGVESPGELVTVLLGTVEGQGSWPISDPDYAIIAERARTLSGVAAVTEQDIHVARPGGAPERVRARVVTAGYFDVLGVRMVAGRPFTEGEVRGSESPDVVVLTDSYARRHWGSADLAVGSEMLVNGRPNIVVGVTRAGFRGASLPGVTELWFPAGALPAVLHDPDILQRSDRQVWGTLIGRPAEGASVRAIESELNALMEAIRREKAGQAHSFLANHFTFRVYAGIGLPPSLRASTARTLSILGGSAALLLLLACANVANLGLARVASLQGSIAIRRALGASGVAVALERLLEAVLVGLAGALLGIGLAAATIGGLRRTGLGLLGVPLDGVTLDHRVVGFTVLAGIMAGAVAGVLPALATRREHALSLLRTGRLDERATHRTGRVLVVAQVALSAVLLVGAGLLAKTLDNLRRIDLGINDAGVVAFDLDPGLQGYDRAATTMLIRELSAALATEPGVASVAAAWSPPFESLHVPYSVKRPDATWSEGSEVARGFQVTPAVFETLGIELIAGRTFHDEEAWVDTARVAVLNESAVRVLYPSLQPAEAVGRFLQMRGSEEPIRVIGVVRDARLVRPADPARSFLFLPWAAGIDVGRFTMYLRTARSMESISQTIRELSTSIDPALPVHGLRTWSSEVRSLLAEQRLVAWLALGLAGFGLLLAAIGLYGILALAVTRRTREIGIRSALGANPRGIMSTIVRAGFAMAAIGVVPGLLASASLSRVLESRLYGIGHLDAGTYVIGTATLLVVAFLASWLPARRATRIDPMSALREN